jgi:hypothetical protein
LHQQWRGKSPECLSQTSPNACAPPRIRKAKVVVKLQTELETRPMCGILRCLPLCHLCLCGTAHITCVGRASTVCIVDCGNCSEGEVGSGPTVIRTFPTASPSHRATCVCVCVCAGIVLSPAVVCDICGSHRPPWVLVCPRVGVVCRFSPGWRSGGGGVKGGSAGGGARLALALGARASGGVALHASRPAVVLVGPRRPAARHSPVHE